jgi:hypothetical protein
MTASRFKNEIDIPISTVGESDCERLVGKIVSACSGASNEQFLSQQRTEG